jgi:peptidoglycan L-alanyl-D-glutamate endopeptidase CwlK
MDTQSITLLQQLHPKIRDAAIIAYNKGVEATPIGVHPVIDQTGRTFAQSAADYAQGRTTPGEIITYAEPGQSYHNYFLALDFHLIIDGQDYWPASAAQALANKYWMTVVNLFAAIGFNSGIYFPNPDEPHLEYKDGYTWQQLYALYNEKKFIPGTEYLNI